MADTFPFSHVQQFVLINADSKFSSVKSGPKHKDGKYDKKKGRNFYEVKDGDGNTKTIGYDGAQAQDDDGNGVAGKGNGDPHQAGTSYTWAGKGDPINGSTVPYYVLPSNQIKGDGVFSEMQPGDYAKVTNPATGQSAYGIYAENGPDNQVGEVSKNLGQQIGVSDWEPTMTDSQHLQYELYPGSGQRVGKSQIKRQTNEEIQAAGKKASEARSVKGGLVIIAGKNSVLISKQLMPAACADPAVMHLGGCPLATGSDSVSVELCPATRVGDACSCNRKVVSGEDTVQVGGACTAAKDTPPSKNLYTPPSLFDSPQTGSQTVPSWAQGPLGPQQAQPSMMDLANQHFEPTATPAWPDP